MKLSKVLKQIFCIGLTVLLSTQLIFANSLTDTNTELLENTGVVYLVPTDKSAEEISTMSDTEYSAHYQDMKNNIRTRNVLGKLLISHSGLGKQSIKLRFTNFTLTETVAAIDGWADLYNDGGMLITHGEIVIYNRPIPPGRSVDRTYWSGNGDPIDGAIIRLTVTTQKGVFTGAFIF